MVPVDSVSISGISVGPAEAGGSRSSAGTSGSTRESRSHPPALTSTLPASAIRHASSPPSIQAPSPLELNEQLEKIVSELNEQFADSGRNLGFRVDSVMNRPVVTVLNQASGEVVRQIPSEVVVRVAHSIEALKGLIFDQSI